MWTSRPFGASYRRFRAQAACPRSRRMVSGSRSMARNNARAGASGTQRLCSQSRKVLTGRPKASANWTWVIPSRWRKTFTRETRRILANCSGLSGCASGSARAAASTSSSVMAFTRSQSVSPRGGVSTGFTVIRVIPVILHRIKATGKRERGIRGLGGADPLAAKGFRAAPPPRSLALARDDRGDVSPADPAERWSRARTRCPHRPLSRSGSLPTPPL